MPGLPVFIFSLVSFKMNKQKFMTTQKLKGEFLDSATTRGLGLKVFSVLFFLDELRKFTISDFPKQTHFGHILITLFFFHPLIDPHFDIVFQPTA